MSNPNALIMKLSDLLGPTYVPVNLNTGLDLNGNCPKDASAAINAFIGQATAKLPSVLIFDIGVACYGSILLPTAENKAAYPSIVTGDGAGHVSLIGMGWDTGIYMMPGSNSHCISGNAGRLGDGKYPVFDPGGTAPAQSNLNIRVAGLAINGNRGTGAAVVTPTATITLGSNQITMSAATSIAIGQLATGTGLASPSFVSAIAGTTVTLVDQTGKPANATASGAGVTVSFYASNSTTGDPRGIITPSGGFNNVTWYCGVSVFSGVNWEVNDCYFSNIPAYHTRFSNFSNLKFHQCTFDGSSNQNLNSDAIHIDGPAQRFLIDSCDFYKVHDDNIALNAPEGYGGSIQWGAITNCNFDLAISGVRMYASGAYTVSDVAISNVTASLQGMTVGINTLYAPLIFLGNNTGTGFIDRITVSNATVYADTYVCLLKISDNCGSVAMDTITYEPRGSIAPSSVYFDNLGGTTAITVQDLSLKNIREIRTTPPGETASVLGGPLATTINRLETDWQIEDNQTGLTPVSYYIDQTNITVKRWAIRALDPTHVAALINGSTWTNLPSITGEGLVGCGFQIPDANVGNNTMYKSATTAGELTWKDGAGAVHGLAAGS